MPNYEYECTRCKNSWEAFLPMDKRHSVSCETCGRPARIIVAQKVILNNFTPYFSNDMNMQINSRRDRDALMKQHGYVDRTGMVYTEAVKELDRINETPEPTELPQDFLDAYDKADAQGAFDG